MTTALLIVLPVIAGVAVLVGGLVTWARRAAGRATRRTEALLGGVAPVRQARARYFGRERAGAAQTRGTGLLTLMGDELLFAQ